MSPIPIYGQLPVDGPMDRVRRAFAASRTTPVNWLALGHSVTEGSSNGSMTTNQIRDRWVNKSLRSLQTSYASSVGGPGFLRTYYEQIGGGVISGSAAGENYWTSSGGGSVSNTDTRAFGSQTYNFAVNETCTLNYVGTSFKLQFDLGGSTFQVNVDGGGNVPVTPGAGSTMQGTYTSPTLTHGTHSAVLTPTAGQALKVRGAFIYDGDETSGIRMWEHGLGAQTAAQYIAAGKPGTVTGLTDPMSSGLCVNPTLVTIMLAINDFIFNTAPATLTSNYQTLISNVKSLCTVPPNFLLIVEYECGQFYGSPPYTNTWAQMATAIKNVAAADPQNVAYMDMSPHFPVPSAGNSYDGGQFNSDQTHPTATGYAEIASLISDVLGPKPLPMTSLTRPAPFKPGLAR